MFSNSFYLEKKPKFNDYFNFKENIPYDNNPQMDSQEKFQNISQLISSPENLKTNDISRTQNNFYPNSYTFASPINTNTFSENSIKFFPYNSSKKPKNLSEALNKAREDLAGAEK